MKSCVLFLRKNHRFNEDAVRIVRGGLQIVGVFDESSAASGGQIPADFYLNFFCEHIHRGRVLESPNVNFHPAPPQYPGRGSASVALFDGAERFGATAHGMVGKVDSGPIYRVRTFPILENDDCDALFSKAEILCLDLLGETVAHLARHGDLPDADADAAWSGRAMSRKDFDRWLVLDQNDETAFRRKVRAARHPKFKGPYVYVHGHRFALDE